MRSKPFFKCLTLILFALLLGSDLPGQGSPDIRFHENTEKMLNRLTSQIPVLMDRALIPGLSVAVIQHGKVVWQSPFGVTANREPVTLNTIFEAASLSKPVFAYGVMKLVDRGMLDLDTPLVSYMPKNELIKVYPKADTSDLRLNRITARTVMTHSTGFPNWFRGNPMSFQFDPGERFSYSGEAFTLLGKVVEKLSGKSLNQFMKEFVFDPLKMTDSSYVWRPDYENRFSGAHNFMGMVTPRRHAGRALPGATLYTTAGDYARFLAALVNGEAIKKKTLEEMLKPQITAHEEGDEKFFWGLGVGVNPSDRGSSVWHWGDNGNVKAYFEVLIREKRGVVFFANSVNGHAISGEITMMATGITRPAIAKRYFRNYPHYTDPALRLNRIYVKNGMKAALEFLEKQGSRVGADAVHRLAYSLVSAKKIGDCMSFLQKGIGKFPENHALHQVLGGLYLIEGQTEQGKAHLDRSLKLKPEQENELNDLGYRLLGGRYYTAAIAVFRLNVETYPDSANCYDSLADAYGRSGNNEMAIRYYELTLKRIPMDKRASRESLESLRTGAIASLKRLREKKSR